jgi:hypothetical protein
MFQQSSVTHVLLKPVNHEVWLEELMIRYICTDTVTTGGNDNIESVWEVMIEHRTAYGGDAAW